ncbi:ACP S-malonyltransferase [Thermodesulfobacteriota bacterium]
MQNKIAFLFPGQNSQIIGMGRDLADEFPECKEIFQQLDDVCEKPMSKLCFEGPDEELILTVNQQPAITAVNLACLKAANLKGIKAEISAGHSLGEFAALVSTGVLTEYDALRIVKKRGELMHRESLSHPGVMTAVMKLEYDKVEEIVTKANEKGLLAIANHNSEQQIVITGVKEPMEYAIEMVKEAKGRAIPLKVSGAWHCDLMKGAVKEFRAYMEDIPFSKPTSTMLFNATADIEDNPEKIKDIMANQLTSPVKWYDIILNMIREGIDTYVDVGPQKQMMGLIGRILPEDSGSVTCSVDGVESLNEFITAVNQQ